MEVIGKVPTVLHTPLMSGANAISGVCIIGAILLLRQTESGDYLKLTMGAVGIVLAMIFGGTPRIFANDFDIERFNTAS